LQLQLISPPSFGFDVVRQTALDNYDSVILFEDTKID